MDDDGSFVWVPGWSTEPEVWRSEIERWPDYEHVSLAFSACHDATHIVPSLREAIAAAAAPVRIVAWSMGAMAALDVAATESGEVAGLYLVGATGRLGWDERVVRAMRREVLLDPARVLERFYPLMFSADEVAEGWLERWLRSAAVNHPDPRALAAGLEYIRTYALERAGDVRVPVFLLHGADDAVCSPEEARGLASRLPDASLTVWPRSGHVPFWTKPERFHEWLAGCLAR